MPYTHVFSSAMDAHVTDTLLDLADEAAKEGAPVRLTTFILDAKKGMKGGENRTMIYVHDEHGKKVKLTLSGGKGARVMASVVIQ
tara:strand:+ start:491 stop:745 length:255 start_codon:yes stop_codon:yes gene_type:complete